MEEIPKMTFLFMSNLEKYLPIANPTKSLPISKINLLKAAAQIILPIVKVMLEITMDFLRPNLSDKGPPTSAPIPAAPKILNIVERWFRIKFVSGFPRSQAPVKSF